MDLNVMCQISSIKRAMALWAVAVWADHFVIATIFYKQLQNLESDHLPLSMELEMKTSFSDLMYKIVK